MWGSGVTEKVPEWKEKTAEPHYAFAQSMLIGSHRPLWNKTQIPNTPCPVLALPLISEPHAHPSPVGMYDQVGASSPISNSLRKET